MPRKKLNRTIETQRSDYPVTYIPAQELVNRVATITKVRKTDLKMVLDAFGQVICDAVLSGESITIPKFGRIEFVVKNQRRINPLTKQMMDRRPYPRLVLLPMLGVKMAIRRLFDERRERRLCATTEPSSDVELRTVQPEDRGSKE